MVGFCLICLSVRCIIRYNTTDDVTQAVTRIVSWSALMSSAIAVPTAPRYSIVVMVLAIRWRRADLTSWVFCGNEAKLVVNIRLIYALVLSLFLLLRKTLASIPIPITMHSPIAPYISGFLSISNAFFSVWSMTSRP